ncbi:MAG: ABC-ATPase domain-containing protein [Candidatus Eisenbacteria bacterium]
MPGDGREQVATRRDAQSIERRTGRAIHDVDLRPFVRSLPPAPPPSAMRTANASGSTSQAARSIESIRQGAPALIDEDTSATNFTLIRDGLMEAMLEGHTEPLVPFLERRPAPSSSGWACPRCWSSAVRESTFGVADRVLVMDHYRPCERTARARELAGKAPPLPANDAEAARFREATEADGGSAMPAGTARPNQGAGSRQLLVAHAELDLSGIEALRGQRRHGCWRGSWSARAATGVIPEGAGRLHRRSSRQRSCLA